MTTKQNEFAMVKYFLTNNYGYAQIQAVQANVVAHRQLSQSMTVVCMGILSVLLSILINNLPRIPHHVKIGEGLFILGMATISLFGIRCLWKSYQVFTRCNYEDGLWNDGFQEIIETIKQFKKLTGKHPAKLGLQGTVRFLTHEARTILHLKAMRRSEHEFVLRRRFRDLHDAASRLMPIPSYEEIYAAAEKGQQQPYSLPAQVH